MALLAGCGTMVNRAATTAGNGGTTASNAAGAGTGTATTIASGALAAGSPTAGGAAATGGGGPAAGPADAAAANAPAGGTPLQGVTDTEIRVGLTGPLSGLFGDVIGEEFIGALDSYVQDINSKGGIFGRQLKIITYNDNLDLAQTLINARKLWEEDKVAALITTFPDGIADYVTRNSIPTFVLGFSASAFSSKYPTIFPILQSGASATYSFTYGLQQAGVPTQGMKVGMLYDTQIIDTRGYLDSAKDAWSLVGANVVDAEPFNFADGDCTALVVKMKSQDIDWWDFEGLGWSLCVSAAQRQNYVPKVGWGNWPTNIGYLAANAGPRVDGVWFMAPADEPETGYPRQQTDAHRAYIDALTKYHPRLTEPIHLDSVVTQTYWIVGEVLGAAFTALGQSPTKEGLLQYLQSIQNFDTGIAPPIESWAPDCKVGVNTIWIGQWRWVNGAPVREPHTGYLSNPFAVEKYGKCFVTAIADKTVTG
jgi:branched-chain amino acid transport system substrate-binding protein